MTPSSSTDPNRDPVAALPEIYLSAEDHDVLSRLVGDLPGEGVAGLLQQELDRAVVCDPRECPRGAVGLNRWVHYVDERSGKPRRVRLVLPKEADIDAGRISILSHVGAGLIGMVEGETVAWADPSGAERRLTVVLVEDPELDV